MRQLEAMSFCVRETKACCALGLVQRKHIPESGESGMQESEGPGRTGNDEEHRPSRIVDVEVRIACNSLVLFCAHKYAPPDTAHAPSCAGVSPPLRPRAQGRHRHPCRQRRLPTHPLAWLQRSRRGVSSSKARHQHRAVRGAHQHPLAQGPRAATHKTVAPVLALSPTCHRYTRTR